LVKNFEHIQIKRLSELNQLFKVGYLHDVERQNLDRCLIAGLRSE